MHKKLAERPYATGAFKDKEKSQSIFSRVFISMISAVERKLVEVKDINEYLEYAKKHKIPEVTLSAKLIETDSKLAVPKYTVLLGFKGKTRFGLEFKKSIKLESIPLLADNSDNEYQAYCSLMQFALLKDFELSLDKESTKGIEIKLARINTISGFTEYSQDQQESYMKALLMHHFAREGFAKHFPRLARVLREEESAKSNTQ
ncbi:MAG: hypothetical protein KDD56_06340 [Bdellovibrionales bacterium]|nr:hypothetical protein [Bdellovibrionales bacterium]